MKVKDCEKCLCAINIDMVGRKGIDALSVTANVSDSLLLLLADSLSSDLKISLIKNNLPAGALSDFNSFRGQSFQKDINLSFRFNFLGFLLIQRSYFTKNKKAIPVIDFSDDIKFNYKELLSYFSPVPFGKIHSYHDNINVIDFDLINKYDIFFKKYIEKIDKRYTEF
ncbi:MAG: hypothetical protein PHH37_02405 [Paludibacter sp.]|nr:hypothetical protein [Paludibacter sp.]